MCVFRLTVINLIEKKTKKFYNLGKMFTDYGMETQIELRTIYDGIK